MRVCLAGVTVIPNVRLLGLDFADLDVTAAAALLAARPAEAPFSYVVTPNADHLVRLARDPALARSIATPAAAAGLARGGRRRPPLGLPAPRVAPGSDLTELLLTQHLQPAERVTIVGLRTGGCPRW